MKILELMDFCDAVLAQYGNMDVLIFSETPEFRLNHSEVELIEIPLSMLSSKSGLALGICLTDDFYKKDRDKVVSAREKPKLRIVR
jgi:hypothetical protein